MRIYELAIVVSAGYPENKIKDLRNKITECVKAEKGKVTGNDFWAKKTLAYPINKEKEGQFVFLTIEAPALSVGFNQKVRLTEGVLRYLLLRKK